MADPLGLANILDDAGAMARADSGDMLGRVASFADQVLEAWRETRELELPWGAPRSVAVLGMGGSAIAGDLVRAIWSDRLTVPVEVVRGYELPAWVDSGTLVIASSKSGDTEETLSALEAALSRRCPVVCVTTGGAMRRVAEAARLPLVAYPDRGAPRASLGSSLAAIVGILERVGVLEVDETEIEAGVAAWRETAAACGPDVPTAENPAKQLAWSLVDRFVIVSASGFLAPVARRWKAQLNENGKTTATYEALPEATHNTVVGFEQPESLRDHLFVVLLKGLEEHPRDAIRAQLVGDVLETAQISHHFVEVGGEGRLPQALSGIAFGDYLSVYVSFMYAVDPTPVEVIDHIKQQLALSDQAGLE